MEAIADSAELIESSRELSTFEQQLSTQTKGSSCGECSAMTVSSARYNSFPGQHQGETLSDLALPFTADELSGYVETRLIGLADTSCGWIRRSANTLWRVTLGVISRQTMERLRIETLGHYRSSWSHSKTFSLAKSFLKHLTKTRLDTRYAAFEVFLEMPKTVKVRKAVTSRVVTQTDVENVLAYIRRAERTGEISKEWALHYSAIIMFGAYTGQRGFSTTSRLTVGQFREALERDKPVLHVEPKQDKIRMEHYVPLHPHVVRAVRQLLDGREGTELMFKYRSLYEWVRRRKIPMSRFTEHFLLGDLRKFAEQHGDVIGWEQSNRAYIMTHGVSGVDWAHYKHPLPETVFDVYMRCWRDVVFTNSR